MSANSSRFGLKFMRPCLKPRPVYSGQSRTSPHRIFAGPSWSIIWIRLTMPNVVPNLSSPRIHAPAGVIFRA